MLSGRMLSGRTSAVAFVLACFSVATPPARGQDDPLPTRRQIADTLETYRERWQSFEAAYTFFQGPEGREQYTDELVFDRGRIYIDRTPVRRGDRPGPGELPWDPWIMCFDGEQTYTVTRRADEADLVLVLPGFDRKFMSMESAHTVLSGWLYEFAEPLDEKLRDRAWSTSALRAGERIDGRATIYLELQHDANVLMLMRFWLAPELDCLPVRRQLLTDDGNGERLLSDFRARRFEWVSDGHFPMEMEWTTGTGTLAGRIAVQEVGKTPGLFEERFATLIQAPANITDTVSDEVYKLVADEVVESPEAQADDAAATKRLIEFLDGVAPEVAEDVARRNDEHRQAREAARSSGGRGAMPWWVVGGALAAVGMGVGLFWLLRRRAGL